MWDITKRFDSQDENVFKYVFTQENAVAEAVLYKYNSFEERTVICCSVMSGCPIGCTFCGSGNYFVRNLTSEEIVYQILYIMEEKKINAADVKKFQIMFMSMGEPMMNFEAVRKAIIVLNKLYPNADLLLSTTCPSGADYSALNLLSKVVKKVGLQFSIHEITDNRRAQLIPTNNRMDLEDIVKVGEKWFYFTDRRPFFNYCTHAGNTSQEDANAILKLFNPFIWNCTISVICEKDESVARSVERQEELANSFASKLLNLGFNVRTFNPAGQDDIGGGCGQLWYVQDWMKKNSDKNRKWR